MRKRKETRGDREFDENSDLNKIGYDFSFIERFNVRRSDILFERITVQIIP